jgi:phosphatidylserine/phosphatidylglycerophosphate/cardiolipin synthase-like enzyme
MTAHSLRYAIPLRDGDYFSFVHAQLARARRRIWVSMFTVNAAQGLDARLRVRTLLHDLALAAGRGVDVRVLIGADAESLSELQVANRVGLGYLKALGVAARWHSGAGTHASHTKFIVVDDDCVITGSHNWSPRSLSRGIDDSIAVGSEGVAGEAAARFAEQWTRGFDIPTMATGTPSRLRLEARSPFPLTSAFADEDQHEGELQRRADRLLAGGDNTGTASILWGDRYRSALRTHFAAAQSSIEVIMFYASFNAARHPTRDLIRALGSARERGVNVRVILDRGQLPDRRSLNRINGRAAGALRRAGVAVEFEVPERVTHSKVVVVDGRFALIGSHNWTAHSLLTYGEATVLIDCPRIAEDCTRDFDGRWAVLRGRTGRLAS